MCVDAEDLAIVEGIIKIAKGFNREVVAKGVETAEQGVRLTKLGCHIAQGYAIARPMPADSMVHWLANWSGPTWQGSQLVTKDIASNAFPIVPDGNSQ
jgi:EAL domain-containing protein (putative c-di-GMP-specific phosphodiesterase class I)